MKHLLKNTKESCNKEGKQEEGRFSDIFYIITSNLKY